MTDGVQKQKYYIFGDESGTWNEPHQVYVRSWVVVRDDGYSAIRTAIDDVNSKTRCNELKWVNLARRKELFDFCENISFRVFITISSPPDIHWETRYRITRNFDERVDALDFGELEKNLIHTLKKKMFDDIRNILFLHFYEKTHIANATKAILDVIPDKDIELLLKIDRPQMPNQQWKDICMDLVPGATVTFPRSHDDQGIQFADVIAGAFHSFLMDDEYASAAKEFLAKIKGKLIRKSKTNPNPNLIFFKEINPTLRTRSGQIWRL